MVDPNGSYQIGLRFRESEGLQFENEEALIYELPAGLIAPDLLTTIDIGIRDNEGQATISGNTVEVSNGKVIVRFNQDDSNFERLKAVAILPHPGEGFNAGNALGIRCGWRT